MIRTRNRLAPMGVLVACLLSCTVLAGCRTIRVAADDFLVPDVPPEASLQAGQGIDRFTIDTPHGLIAATRISRPGNRTAVLYCGGNQFRTEVSGGSVVAAFPASVDLILFDYPGYGDSSGTPTVDKVMASATAVYDRLLKESGKAYARRAVYGTSMGGFVASHVAGQRNPDMLVLEGTAASASRMMKSLVPWFAKPFVAFDIEPALGGIDNVAKLRHFRGRALLLVGSADAQTRPEVMRDFAASLQREGVNVQFHVIHGRGHGAVLDDAGARKMVRDFLDVQP